MIKTALYWYKDMPSDQCVRIEYPTTRQLALDKGAETMR